ncbi:MAG: phosphoglucosamine mutase [Bacteroidales bacterium]|jgi:phosphomannomutase
MTLISSISGIRGTIGGTISNNLTPIDIVKYTSAYSKVLLKTKQKPLVLVGRDGRVSGPQVQSLIVNTLLMMGIDVIDCGLTTTPTIEMGIIQYKTDGGIMVSASHNPMNWNALKLFNNKGEFIDKEVGIEIQELVLNGEFEYADYKSIGKIREINDVLEYHVKKIIELPYVNVDAIKKANLKVAIDAINSTGGIAVPYLLDQLGVKKENIFTVNCEIQEEFAHNPEPLEKNLTDLSELVKDKKCDVGFAVDPDVDRLALISQDGSYFGEEYTLVACADFVLRKNNGNTVSNLSSSRALKDITEKYNAKYYASAVGEVNVSTKMKAVNAVIGGEGNGGVILPELHYGRDALLGIALILSFLAESGKKLSVIRESYPYYYMAKEKISIKKDTDFSKIKEFVKNEISEGEFNEEDGLKIDFKDSWIHLRTSNTEPIIRVYSEAKSLEEAKNIAKKMIDLINTIV